MSVIGLLKNLIIAVFVLLAFIAVAANVRLPFGYKLLAVQSGSMEPSIPVGSIVLSKPTSDFLSPEPATKFLKGDVIVFSKGDYLVSHRAVGIIKQDGEFFYETKGDANKTADSELISEKQVAGKIILQAPYLGRLPSFVREPIGYFLLILIPSLYIILSEIWAIISEIRKARFKIPNYSLAMPAVLIFATSVYLVGGSLAYFSDTETSTGNVFQAAEAFCDEGPTWLSAVTQNLQGTRKDGSAILPARTDPNVVLGVANWTPGGSTGFFSLGFIGGNATFAFPYQILNTNASLRFYEATNGRASYPLETADVFVSQDGVTFVLLGQITSEPSGDGVTTLDLSSVSLSSIKYVKLVETSNPAIHTNDADGFDIDAVAAEFGNCD